MAEFNLVDLHEAIAGRYPERPSITRCGDTLSYGEVRDRRRQVAAFLMDRGLGAVTPPAERWLTGQDHVGFLLHNGPEYLVCLLGALGARVVPFNVNWRYLDGEVAWLLRESRAAGLVYHSEFAPTVERVSRRLDRELTLVQVADASDNDLVSGATDYQTIIEGAAAPDGPRRSPDDRYLMFTGGTTGRPKGVIWRQSDLFVASLGGQIRGHELDDIDAVLARCDRPQAVTLAPPPFIHGFAQWASLATMLAGGVVSIQGDVRSFDPVDIWDTIARDEVTVLYVVGDAFVRPLLEVARTRAVPPRLRTLFTGGAALNEALKADLLDLMPDLRIIDLLGSSESGTQAMSDSAVAQGASRRPSPTTVVLDEARGVVLPPGVPGEGWLASRRRTPTGYLHDQDATERTFPTIDGVTYSVPGDRVRLLADGGIEFRGRDAAVINSGGEKVFAEEVEEAIRALEEVIDATVIGRPNEALGNEVVALVQFAPGCSLDIDGLRQRLRTSLAGFKLPRAVVGVASVERLITGKPDYEWARSAAEVDAARPATAS